MLPASVLETQIQRLFKFTRIAGGMRPRQVLVVNKHSSRVEMFIVVTVIESLGESSREIFIVITLIEFLGEFS